MAPEAGGAGEVEVNDCGTLITAGSTALRNDPITVNLLHPSTLDTPFVRSHYAESEWARWVDPHSLGSLMLWLCSPAGRDVSGSSIALPARQAHPAYIWPGVSE